MLKRLLGIRPETKKKELLKKIIEIQSGNEELRNQFIAEYKDFIIETLMKITKKTKNELEGSDEFSVAFIAFDEAVSNYSTNSSQTFASFAALVIKRRLVDFWRKEERQQSNIVDKEFEVEEDSSAYSEYLVEKMKQERLEEIRNYSEILNGFGIDWKDLSEESPRHLDAKRTANEIAKILAKDDNLVNFLYEKKKLPIKDLLDRTNVSKKTIERNRKYIIAVTIIIVENYVHLTKYLDV